MSAFHRTFRHPGPPPIFALQAIETKYLGPTNHRGARVRARCDAGRVIMPWDHALNPVQNHAAAARLLANRFGWDVRESHIGATQGGYVVVFTSRSIGGTKVTPTNSSRR